MRFAILVLLTAACSKAPPLPEREAIASASVPLPPVAVIDLQPLTISFRGQPIARLFADGRTESAGPNAPGTALLPGPTLHADGTMTMTRGGVTARIDERGDVYVSSPAGASPREQLFGHIAGDRFTFAGSAKPWDVRVQGNMIEFGALNSSQIDGDVTSSMRHTALVMAVAFYIEGALSTRP